jgi:hypothetical protein
MAQANWRTAGVTPNGGIPARTTICAQVAAAGYGNGSSDATADIQAASDACPPGQTVLLSAGTFRADQPIYVNISITLRGAGAGVTTIVKLNGAYRHPETGYLPQDANQIIVAGAGGAGSVVSYNYFDDAHIWYAPDWIEVSANASHFSGPHHVLFEGNRAVNFDSDFTHGSSYSHTVLRNHFAGFRLSYPGQSNARTIGLAYGAYNFSFVGNVLGIAGQMAGWTYDAGTVFNSDRHIWKLGYDPTYWEQEADPQVLASTIKEGNFDFLTNSVQWSGAPAAIPNSYYLTRNPAFF